MSHTGVDVIDFILFTIYPAAVLFAVEIVSRAIKIPKWLKLMIQGIISVIFAIVYHTFPDDYKLPLTAIVLIALGIALFYQAKRAKINPEKIHTDHFTSIWYQSSQQNKAKSLLCIYLQYYIDSSCWVWFALSCISWSCNGLKLGFGYFKITFPEEMDAKDTNLKVN